jgi:chorismate mutase
VKLLKFTAFLFFEVKMNLEQCRKVIDAVDTEILALLNRRAELSRKIGTLKSGAGLPIVDTDREDEVLRRIARENAGQIRDEVAIRIYDEILCESRRIQFAIVAEIASNREARK